MSHPEQIGYWQLRRQISCKGVSPGILIMHMLMALHSWVYGQYKLNSLGYVQHFKKSFQKMIWSWKGGRDVKSGSGVTVRGESEYNEYTFHKINRHYFVKTVNLNLCFLKLCAFDYCIIWQTYSLLCKHL